MLPGVLYVLRILIQPVHEASVVGVKGSREFAVSTSQVNHQTAFDRGGLQYLLGGGPCVSVDPGLVGKSGRSKRTK